MSLERAAAPAAARGRWSAWAEDRLEAVAAAGRWRSPRSLDARGPEGTAADGAAVVSFASNDYLGLASHPEVVDAASRAAERWGAGAGSARLIVGSRPVHDQLESELAAWRGEERAALFPTGFAANLGVLSALGGGDALICSDELNHASIVDGCRLARADVAVYRHRDTEHLERLLVDDRRAIVVTDAVFSMDGDLAPIEELVEVCARHEALLVVDEAHSVLGSAPDLAGVESVRVGTLSKTLGSQGGFVAGPRRFIDLIVNLARPYIFTTALAPPSAAAALAALGILRSSEGEELRSVLAGHVESLAPGWPSPIVPVLIGDEARALEASARLMRRGILVPAIRPPSVPPGTSRLRVTVSALHTGAQVRALGAAIGELCGGNGPGA